MNKTQEANNRSGMLQTPSVELAIIVPTFNERPNIALLVERIQEALPGVRWELVFVDDDSPDGTANEVRRLAQSDSRIRILQRLGRRGLSSACIEGMLSTAAPFLAVMDADLQHDETVLPQMHALMVQQELDLVIATRNRLGGSKGDFARSRAVASDLAARLSSLVYKSDVSDPMSGFFMISRDCLLENVHHLTGKGFKILVDILATSSRPLRTAEIPYTFRSRHHGESKLDLNVTLEYANLLIEKATRGWIPSNFVMFGFVGGLGAIVHVAVLVALYQSWGVSFARAQVGAIVCAMTWNFFLNNITTFRSQRLRGFWQILRGLMLYYLVCSFGALTSYAVSQYLFVQSTAWMLAGISGVFVSSVWNYVVNSLVTWRWPRTAAGRAKTR